MFAWPLLLLFAVVCCGSATEARETPADWKRVAKDELARALRQRTITSVAKNLVLMIGDGLGLPTVTAGRIYAGQKLKQSGEDYKLNMETFPYVGLSKTYNADRQVSDSAGTATAMMSGVKTNYGTLGVNSDVVFGKACESFSTNRRVETLLDIASREGKSVGVITTARITHATPAASYAHLPYRYWESDTDFDLYSPESGCDGVKDIAKQLIEDNSNIQVILGGGRRSFYPQSKPDPETGKVDKHQRKDKDLIQAWKDKMAAQNAKHSYVETKGEFDAVDPGTTDYLFGLFASGHMEYELDRNTSATGEPSLVEMVDKAIKVLQKNPKGFFILIEGARIDHAHHDNDGKRALEETVVFDQAVKKVVDMTSEEDTLVVVTADHSHVFGIAGYPTRGNDILGLVDRMEEGEEPYDSMPYTTLTYSNGPVEGRENLTNVDTTSNTFKQAGCVKMGWETHGGEDVPIYAKGPMSHLFHTTHEQHYIAHVMMYAACIGDDNTEACKTRESTSPCRAAGLGSALPLVVLAVGVALGRGLA